LAADSIALSNMSTTRTTRSEPEPRCWMTAPEVAADLRISESTVRRLIRQRDLPALPIGGQYRVDGDALEARIAAATTTDRSAA